MLLHPPYRSLHPAAASPAQGHRPVGTLSRQRPPSGQGPLPPVPCHPPGLGARKVAGGGGSTCSVIPGGGVGRVQLSRGHPREGWPTQLLRFGSIAAWQQFPFPPVLSPPPGSGAKQMLRPRCSCARIWGKGGFEKPPLAPQGLRGCAGLPALSCAVLALSFGDLLGQLLIQAVPERGAQTQTKGAATTGTGSQFTPERERELALGGSREARWPSRECPARDQGHKSLLGEPGLSGICSHPAVLGTGGRSCFRPLSLSFTFLLWEQL